MLKTHCNLFLKQFSIFKESEPNSDGDNNHNENENENENEYPIDSDDNDNLIRNEEAKLITSVPSESEYNLENTNDYLNEENTIVNTDSENVQCVLTDEHNLEDNVILHKIYNIVSHQILEIESPNSSCECKRLTL
jgi:hypothetical protein